MTAREQPKLTPIQRMAREAAERSRHEQGLPPRITDAALVKRVAEIVRTHDHATSDATLARTG